MRPLRRSNRREVVVAEVKGEPDHAWKALSLVNDWIKHAETKAGATLAAAGVVGGVLFNLMKGRHNAGWNLDLAATVCGGAALATGVLAAVSLWPRLGHKEDPTSALYFSHIARKHETQASYHETLKLLTVDSDLLIKEIAGQVYVNAGIAHKKFIWSGWALRALVLAFGALGLVTIIIAKRSL